MKCSDQLMLMMLAAGGLFEMQRSADAHMMLAAAGLVEMRRSADAYDAGDARDGSAWAG